MGEVTRQVTASTTLYIHPSPTKWRQVFSLHNSQNFGILYLKREKLTLSSEDSWSANPGLLWFLVFIFQVFKVIKILNIQLTNSWNIINWRCLWGDPIVLQFVFLRQKAKWFGPNWGLPARAIRRVGMLQAIPIAIVSQPQPCNNPLFNTCSRWQPLWRS